MASHDWCILWHDVKEWKEHQRLKIRTTNYPIKSIKGPRAHALIPNVEHSPASGQYLSGVKKTRVKFANSERWAMKFTIAAECSEVSTLKNKRNHRCFCQTHHEFCWKYVPAAWQPYWLTKGTNFWREEAEHWSPIDGRCGNVGSTEQTNQSSPGGRNKRSKTNGKIAIEIDSKEEKTIPSGKTIDLSLAFRLLII